MPALLAHNEIICGVAAFKRYCFIGFRKALLMEDTHQLFKDKESRKSIGHISPISFLADMPKDEILKFYIQEAILLNENKIKYLNKILILSSLEIPGSFYSRIEFKSGDKDYF